jgi:hypothetical protein
MSKHKEKQAKPGAAEKPTARKNAADGLASAAADKGPGASGEGGGPSLDAPSQGTAAAAAAATAVIAATSAAAVAATATVATAVAAAAVTAAAVTATADVPAGAKETPRWRRWMPDLAKGAVAVAVIGVGVAIWYQPPLIKDDSPYVSYRFGGRWFEDAVLYRPLAMPTRYYIALPRRLAGRYEWFAVDRRREVVAIAEAPHRRGVGGLAIRRSDPMGVDLEFRTLDGSEWRIYFFDDAIVFSNAVLAVRLDTRRGITN